MSAATLSTAAGAVRTQSSCRYVLIGWRYHNGATTKPRVAKRSDSIETIRKVRKSKGFASSEFWVIFDTVTKEEVK